MDPHILENFHISNLHFTFCFDALAIKEGVQQLLILDEISEAARRKLDWHFRHHESLVRLDTGIHLLHSQLDFRVV